MSKSKKRAKTEYKIKKLIKELERKILINSLKDWPTHHWCTSLNAAKRVLVKRKDRAAQYRQWREEKRQNKLNKQV